MNKSVWVELLKSNAVVTDAYLKAIGSAYEKLGYDVNYVYNCLACGCKSSDIYVVGIAPSAAKLRIKGAKHIVFWAQGIWPEESLLRNDNKAAYWLSSRIEKFALKSSDHVFAVSKAQVSHYEGKYGLDLVSRSYVMPCSNETFHSESFFAEGKYESPVFVYAGSLAKYQCVDKMLDAFSRIQKVEPSAEFLFYTAQQDEARSLVSGMGLKNVTVSYAEPDRLKEVLARAKYGFVIRDDSPVNRVATPTKISSYISNGVIPVFSESLEAFSESSEGIVRLPYRESSIDKDFLLLESEYISADRMFTEYREYFEREFDYANRISDICDFLRG